MSSEKKIRNLNKNGRRHKYEMKYKSSAENILLVCSTKLNKQVPREYKLVCVQDYSIESNDKQVHKENRGSSKDHDVTSPK